MLLVFVILSYLYFQTPILVFSDEMPDLFRDSSKLH